MNARTINQTFNLLALVANETTLTKTGSYHVGPCPFCGGRDRFTLKATPTGYRWYCRKCGDGKYHTAVDYIMLRDGLDFKEALAQMGGESVKNWHSSKPPRREPISTLPTLPDLGWQAEAFRMIDEASDCLLYSSEGQTGRDYLTGRGLHRETWQAHLLGFRYVFDPIVKRKRPAISVPWWDCNPDQDVVTAIKYRFVDVDLKGLRYIALKGSVPILYGLWDAVPEHDTLLLIEGEINALSIWQCMPSNVTCLSIGSESGGRPEIIRNLSVLYRRVFIWVDNAKRARKIRDIVGRSVHALQSPERDGVKWDANELLKSGLLSSFLTQIFGVACLGVSLVAGGGNKWQRN